MTDCDENSGSQIAGILSGRRTDARARIARMALSGLAPIYGAVIKWRNRRYDSGQRIAHPIPAPVISVGNITAGGTGKSPMVMWVARFFHEKGFRVACIRRGYRARGQSLNDESLEFLQRLPGVIQIQDADRVKAAELAVKRHGAEIIVLDDGFQHRRIRRDLDIVLIDATVPYGYDKLLPRGLLREPISAIRRADVIVLSRVDQVSEQQRIAIHQRMRANNPHASWAETMARPSAWQSTGGEKIEIGKLAIPRVYGFCGIGNPGGFQRTLQKLAAEGSFEFCGFQSFPDHHAFSQKDIRQLVSRAREQDCEAMVCTHKDLVRIDPAQLNGLPLFALLIDIEFLKGQLELESQLSNTVIERRKSS